MRAIDRRHFTVDGFIAKIAAGILTVLPVFLLLLQHLTAALGLLMMLGKSAEARV
jgi:hypothetical protein